MGAWAYYSPLWLGALLVLALNESIRALVPTLSPGQQALVVAAAAAVVGLECQLLMVGAQGVFAQVLPVPRGRSIRGGGARLAGGLLIAALGFGDVAALLGYEGLFWPATVLAAVALAAGAGAAVVYIWETPAAAADFRTDGRE